MTDRFATTAFCVICICQHIPVTKSLVMSCLSSICILKVLTNASNNNYANDLLAFRLYCITYIVLTVCVPFPYEESCGIRFLIIVFSSALVELKLLLYDSFWFSSWLPY